MIDFKNTLAETLGVGADCISVVVNGVNKNLRVMTEEIDLFARFSPTSLHARHDLEREAEILDWLAREDAPSCRLYRYGDQPVFGPFDAGDRQYNLLLSETIHGREMTPTPFHAKAFGQALGKIHSLPSEHKKWRDDHRAALAESHAAQPFRGMLEELGKLAETIQLTDPRRQGICHGDAWLGNALECDGKAVLFDFEYARIGDISYDVATFIWALRSAGLDNEIEVFEGFVEGYKESFDIEFSTSELRRNILQKEMDNLVFLSNHVALSDDIVAASKQFALSTIDFIQTYEASGFSWC